MKLQEEILIVFTLMLMVLSAAGDVRKNLTGVVGGSITLPDPVPEKGFLLFDQLIIASVSSFVFELQEDVFLNRVQWNKNSGLFTITDLQETDSGVYTIDSKKGRVVIKSYNLTVYDSAPTPAVKRLDGSSDSCRLLCSTDKRTSLLWYKDEEILNQNHSVLSLLIIVQNQNLNSSYRWVSANPANSKTQKVDLRRLCVVSHSDTRGVCLTDGWGSWMFLIPLLMFVCAVVVGVIVTNM